MNKVLVVVKRGMVEVIQKYGSVDVQVIDLDAVDDGIDDSWNEKTISEFKDWAKELPHNEVELVVDRLTRSVER